MDLFGKISKWIKMKLTHDNDLVDSNSLEYKIIVLGENLTGKSSICNRFALNEFNLEIKPTLASECYTKTLKLFEQIIKLYIVDIDEHVMSSDRSYLYQDVKGAFIVYDITKSKTFEKIDNWILDIRQNCGIKLPLVILGNKKDLIYLRNVDYEEGLEKANNLNCEFIETSCVETESVKDAFKTMVGKIYYNDLPESKKNYFKIYFSNINNKENNKMISNEDLLIESNKDLQTTEELDNKDLNNKDNLYFQINN